jgi:predicted 3-demethylubiquinone-9 3-methyltransferase (glyoxalase superfamily)
MKGLLLEDTWYPTREAARQAISALLHGTPLGQTLDPPAERLLRSLIARHPSASAKIGPGIAWISVQATPGFGQRPCFMIHRVDGTEIDVSYRQCLRPSTQREDVAWCARQLISAQIVAYKARSTRDDGRRVCALTGQVLAAEDVEIDHQPPATFQHLWHTFLAEHAWTEDALWCAPRRGGIGHELMPTNVACAWQAYHARYAVLRPLSRQAHRALLPEVPHA